MNEWTTSPLEDLATFQKGRKVEVINQARNGFLPYLGAGVISGRANSEFASIIGAVLASENDLLMLWDGERSGLVGTGKRGVVSSTVAKLTPKPKIDGRFLCYALFRYFDWIQARRTGTGVPHVPKDLAKILQVDHPADKSEQLRIANVLDTIDEAISTTEAVIAKLKQVRAGMLHDMLSYGLDEHGQLRDPITHPEQFKDSPIGRIPKEWIFGPLSRFVPKAEYGISSCLGENGVPVLRMNNISGGEAQLSDLKYSSAHIPDRLWLRPGDVLFNRTNSWEHVGRTGIWRGQIERTTFASYLVRLNNNPDLLNSELLNLWLNWPMIQIAVRRFATPAVQQVNINPTNLRQVQAAFPKNINEQNEIVVRIGQQDSAIRSLLAENIKLKSIKFGFQDDLLTARVRVPETVSFQESKL